jgi:pyruvate formate lyase activating enzyme
MKEAMFYEQLDNKTVQCHLCPHRCIIEENKTGICRIRKNVDGKLMSLSYGKISSYAMDPIEKKPLIDYKSGSQILSIGSYGCNLKCKFCQNYRIAHGTPNCIDLSPKALVAKAKKQKDNIGIAYTYNEPLINYEYVLETAKLAKEQGLDNVLVTNGYINKEPFQQLLPYIDAANIDLKAFNNDFYQEICFGSLAEVKEIIALAYDQIHIELTVLLIDDLNTDQKELEQMFQWISSLDETIVVHLARYFPRYKLNNPPTAIETLVESQKLARKYLKNVHLGNV